MTAFISDELIEEINNSNEIVDLVSEYVRLKKSGRNYMGLCPFHAEKTPSFSVSSEKQIFHCFGCGVGGNAIHFISKIENLEFIEAVRFLADRAKINVPENTGEVYNSEKVKLKEEILKINIDSAKYFHHNLGDLKAKVAIEYMNNRGLSSETIKKFGLGFSFGFDNDLYSFLKEKGYSEKAILESGVVYLTDANKFRDKFRARVMFPILDVRDRVIGFGGRVLDNTQPKYMNSPETLVFNKRRNLYGLNLAKKSESRSIVVVEGYMDAISLYQYGIINVVATLGTAFTIEQARLLRKYFDEIMICYDTDSAGQNAAIRSLDLISTLDIPVKVIALENAKDPDEFIRKFGQNSFKEAMRTAKTLVEFKIELLKSQVDINDTQGKIAFLNKMSAVLAKISNDIERDAYAKKIAQETGISVDAIYSEINKNLFGKAKIIKAPKTNLLLGQNTKNLGENTKVLNAEKMLIALISINNDSEVFEYVKAQIHVEDFSSEILRRIAQKIFSLQENKKEATPSDIIKNLQEDEVNTYTEIIQKDYNFESSYKQAKDLVDIIHKGKLETRKQVIFLKMNNPDLSKQEKEMLDQELKVVLDSLADAKKNKLEGRVSP
jgi:DNA primase